MTEGLDHETGREDYTKDGSVDLKGNPVRRSKSGGWTACCFIVVYEVFERMAYFGISVNLVFYLTNKIHMGTVTSSNNVTNWVGTVWMTPILGAYVADTHLGRYWTFIIGSIIYLLVNAQHNVWSYHNSKEANKDQDWKMYQETVPTIDQTTIKSSAPLELMNLTKDTTNCLWYVTSFNLEDEDLPMRHDIRPVIQVSNLGHAMHIFVNDVYIETMLPVEEHNTMKGVYELGWNWNDYLQLA